MIRPLADSWRLVSPRFWRDLWAYDPAHLFLLLWLVWPLVMFCVARSRLPLYVLPLLVPIALLLAMRLRNRAWLSARWGPTVLTLIVIFLLGIKWRAAIYPYHNDARAVAQLISSSLPSDRVKEVVYLDY
jgi:4-amino-4-deoxy-L-arabinose transferase-like glycosyltransferase